MKKALIGISFGTSYAETRQKNIEACEQALQDACPDRVFFRAWTSSMIRQKMAEREQLFIDSPECTLEKLVKQGYDDVAIQSLHIINGNEYEKIATQIAIYQPYFQRLVLGKPLLNTFDDYQYLIDALKTQAPPLNQHECVLFMGHGTPHPSFATYACLDHLFRQQQLPFRVACVESYPELDTVLPDLQHQGIRKIHLMPLMLVAGDHALHDMASDDADSWQSQINALGIATECHLQGLGENPLIRALFTRHLCQAINQDETSQGGILS